MAAAEPGKVYPVFPGESFLRGVNRGWSGLEKRVGRGCVQGSRSELTVNVSPFRETPGTGREGVIEGAEVLGRGVVDMSCCVGGCLHVV